MPTKSRLKLAHELTRDPAGRGKSGKRLLAAVALIGVVAVFLIMRRSGGASAPSGGTGGYYDAAGNLYDANGNLLAAAAGGGGGGSTGAADSGLSDLSKQLDALQAEVDQLVLGGQPPAKPPTSTDPKQPHVPGPGEKKPKKPQPKPGDKKDHDPPPNNNPPPSPLPVPWTATPVVALVPGGGGKLVAP